MSIINEIAKKCYAHELNGLKPCLLVIGGKQLEEINEEKFILAGTPEKTSNISGLNISGNKLTMVEVDIDFCEVYCQEKK